MDKSYKPTQGQINFIGSKFPTPKGGTLTVTGVAFDENGDIKKNVTTCCFSIHCDICNLDVELFPNEFTSYKSSLLKGQIPCGCSLNPKWSEDQYIVRVKRVCKERGYVFLGWKGDFKGNTTKLSLYNPKNNHTWFSTSIATLLIGQGDPLEGNERTRLASILCDDEFISYFHEAGFSADYKFWRSDKKDSRGYHAYWNYTCKTCSDDEYVKVGICSGIFESHHANLRVGNKPCRCSKSYRWNQEEREYQINKICKEEGLKFIGWVDEEGYKNNSSKLKWFCTENHECMTDTKSFIKGIRCKTCNNIKNSVIGTFYGYYPERKDEKDYLYVINFNNEYIKVGRSFDIKSRIRSSKGLLKMSGMSLDQIVILRVLSSTHKKVYDTEQWLHKELTERGFYHEKSTWTVETFDTDAEDTIYKLLEGSDLVDENIPLY